MFENLKFGANVITEDGTPMVVIGINYGNYVPYMMNTKYGEMYYYRKDGSVWGPMPLVITKNHKSYNTDRNPKLLEEWKQKMQLKEVVYNPE